MAFGWFVFACLSDRYYITFIIYNRETNTVLSLLFSDYIKLHDMILCKWFTQFLRGKDDSSNFIASCKPRVYFVANPKHK